MEEKRNVPDVLSEVTLMLEILKEVQYAPYDKDVCVVGRYQFARRVLDDPEVKKALAEKKDKVLIEYDENGKGAAFNIYGKPIRQKREYNLNELLAQARLGLFVDIPITLNNLHKGGVSTRTLINQDNSLTEHTIIDKLKPDVDDLKEKEEDFHVTPHITASQAKDIDIVAPVKFNDGHIEEIHIQSLKTISGRPKKNNLEDYNANVEEKKKEE